jgi:hypothetical protein
MTSFMKQQVAGLLYGLSRQGDNCALRGEDGYRREKLQLAGSKDGGWVYNRGGQESQNGNPWLIC